MVQDGPTKEEVMLTRSRTLNSIMCTFKGKLHDKSAECMGLVSAVWLRSFPRINHRLGHFRNQHPQVRMYLN